MSPDSVQWRISMGRGRTAAAPQSVSNSRKGLTGTHEGTHLAVIWKQKVTPIFTFAENPYPYSPQLS